MQAFEQLSHRTIYRRIEEDKRRGGVLYRRGSKLIPGRVDITQRPPEVDSRERIGDWEGDTIHGKNAHLVTLVERATRFTLAKQVLRKTKEEVADAMLELLGKVPVVRTVTLDNGGEFADHSGSTRHWGQGVLCETLRQLAARNQ